MSPEQEGCSEFFDDVAHSILLIQLIQEDDPCTSVSLTALTASCSFKTSFKVEMTFCKALNSLALASFRDTHYCSVFCLSSALESMLQEIINTKPYEKLIILILEMLEQKLLYKKKPVTQQFDRATFSLVLHVIQEFCTC